MTWLRRLWRAWVEFACWEPTWPAPLPARKPFQPLLSITTVVQPDASEVILR